MVRVWTHTSIAGGIELAFERSASVWGNTLQIFAKSPRGWAFPVYAKEKYMAWMMEREKHHQAWWLIHSNYLVNLAKPLDDAKAEIASVLHDIEVAHALQYEAINVHIGKEKWRSSQKEAMQLMTKNVAYIIEQAHQKWWWDVQFLFENTAGQGSEIGSSFAELKIFVHDFLGQLPVKFCIDTAHCRWGWINLDNWDTCIDQFNESIWIDRLYAFHLNDAKVPLWAHLDRHASLWRWFIGRPVLSKVILRASKHNLPMFIETPEIELWSEEVEAVKRIARGEVDRIEQVHHHVFQQQALKKFAAPTSLFGE